MYAMIVELVVAPESGAYTAAYVNLLAFQAELPDYIACKTRQVSRPNVLLMCC